MDILTLLFIAIGLSMDAFAVSVANGAILGCLRGRKIAPSALKIGFFFGGFQCLMPILGWLAGVGIRQHFKSIDSVIMTADHWIAFGVLSLIGGKMIYESLRLSGKGPGAKERTCCADDLVVMTGLAIATSIDALAVGLSFSFLGVSVPLPAVFIGIVTFVVSFGGVYLGSRIGHFFEKKIGIAGGIILVLIGTKILLEHLAAK
ncbi:MAG: hypothetical protein A2583_03395 [Bdellovibrionales bacterium RIFOXYD1_FULL_53_11]|nr:MAG: hypothetical protein A2583_03395 [Bdellovibrionales bacterium RIFOXYD1_FULL_53_11]